MTEHYTPQHARRFQWRELWRNLGPVFGLIGWAALVYGVLVVVFAR